MEVMIAVQRDPAFFCALKVLLKRRVSTHIGGGHYKALQRPFLDYLPTCLHHHTAFSQYWGYLCLGHNGVVDVFVYRTMQYHQAGITSHELLLMLLA
jgi:hypothetical protein